jgi:hypothetical protein
MTIGMGAITATSETLSSFQSYETLLKRFLSEVLA